MLDGQLEQLVRECIFRDRPIQALYLMFYKSEPSIKQKISQFAWFVKNWVRPLGYRALGLPCQLMGTGMAFPFKDLQTISLASGEIVEDMKLGIELACMNRPTVFSPGVVVTSFFPDTDQAAEKQRTRWEHGHLGMIQAYFPRLVVSSLHKFQPVLLALALDLLVPPLAMFIMLLTLLLLITSTSLFFSDFLIPFYVVVASWAFVTIAVFFAWLGWGRKILHLHDFLLIPQYILSKLKIYFRFIHKREKDWNRTERK